MEVSPRTGDLVGLVYCEVRLGARTVGNPVSKPPEGPGTQQDFDKHQLTPDLSQAAAMCVAQSL
jgi:hypothetical protein